MKRVDPRATFSFVGLLGISILGVVRWGQVIRGDRELPSTGLWGPAWGKAQARCFPLMILAVWVLTITLGLTLAADAGLISLDVKRARWFFAAPVAVLLALAISVTVVNKPAFIVPRTKRLELGLLTRDGSGSARDRSNGPGARLVLFVPTWDDEGTDDVIVEEPSLAEIEHGIRALDGRTRNDLYLALDDGRDRGPDAATVGSAPPAELPWVGICGGPDLFHVSYNVTGAGEFYAAVHRGAGDDTLEIVCGGQNTEFPRHELVSRDVALDVAVAFATTGERAENVAWERSR